MHDQARRGLALCVVFHGLYLIQPDKCCISSVQRLALTCNGVQVGVVVGDVRVLTT